MRSLAGFLAAACLAVAIHAHEEYAHGEFVTLHDQHDGWQERLSPDAVERWEAQGSMATHPLMMYDVLGVRYRPVFDLPLSAFHDALVAETARMGESGGIIRVAKTGIDEYANAEDALIRNFNIQLMSHPYEIRHPPTATLFVDLSKRGSNRLLQWEMDVREGSTYYLPEPRSATRQLREAAAALGQFPTMTLPRLAGFEFNESTIEDMMPLGVPLTYNIRFGSVRVDTGFQWAGRPVSIPFRGREFLK